MPHKYLGLVPQLATGVRLPDISIPPVLKALRDNQAYGTLMLSYHRETGPEDLIKSPSESPLRGHTGTSITEYITKSREYSDTYGVLIQIEADHVSLTPSVERAIKRIAGGGFEYGLTEAEAEESLRYIEREFEEVTRVGGVDFVTIDTCEAIELGVDKLGEEELRGLYEERLDHDVRKRLERKYLGRVFKFVIDGRKTVYVKFSLNDLMRVSLKYLRSIEYVRKVLDLITDYIRNPFGVEIALDEVPEITPIKDLVFYISELNEEGIYPDFIAPNIGFRKREDFTNNLDELRERLELIDEVLKAFGSLISFHSGSGTHPYSDKGFKVWETIREVTGGAIKYKVSGVYVQLLLEVMSKFPKGSNPRRLYEEIYSIVVENARKYVESRKGLYSPELEKMLREYEAASAGRPENAFDPRTDLFRHYFFLFQSVKDSKGVRYLRNKVLEMYEEDSDLRSSYEREAYEFTSRMLKKLGLAGKSLQYTSLTL